jgi:transposase
VGSREEAAVSGNSIAVVALDLHKMFTRAVTMGPRREVMDDRRISHADHAEMESFFLEFEKGTDILMEATFNWPWVADLAEKCGLKPHLGDPLRIKEFRKGLAKSDRKDCIGEGTLWLRRMFPEAYRAPKGVRRMRGLYRMRGLFVRMRTSLKCNVHGQLFRQGVLLVDESSIFTLKARAALKRIDMDESERSELARKFALMADLDIHIKDVERVIKLDLKDNDDARIVDSIPGFGVILSHGILSEIGELKRFPNGRALAAYAGVLPLDNESADKDLGKHTGSHSNRFLRWILLEAVNGAVKKSPRMKSLLERVKGRNRSAPGKARVAVARELAELAHLLLSRRVLFTETPPPRPGSPKAVAAANRAQRGKRAPCTPAKKRARKRKRRPVVTLKG